MPFFHKFMEEGRLFLFFELQLGNFNKYYTNNQRILHIRQIHGHSRGGVLKNARRDT